MQALETPQLIVTIESAYEQNSKLLTPKHFDFALANLRYWTHAHWAG